ncbi:hypothetical protein QC762_0050080 [Podospora pseudocomata]|uniref:Uncharacterized protein n=1 Tax=Podospora pseudocomata TaxID=2093779 RepID=A0ABR0GIA6_9PEZI|nr:hypothetical protein QC762_0050080 [Podospora pseudocomata]
MGQIPPWQIDQRGCQTEPHDGDIFSACRRFAALRTVDSAPCCRQNKTAMTQKTPSPDPAGDFAISDPMTPVSGPIIQVSPHLWCRSALIFFLFFDMLPVSYITSTQKRGEFSSDFTAAAAISHDGGWRSIINLSSPDRRTLVCSILYSSEPIEPWQQRPPFQTSPTLGTDGTLGCLFTAAEVQLLWLTR